jgi:UDP-glucose 4-epimerase
MTIIGVSGASGFIGGALVPALAARGYELRLIDNRSGLIKVEHREWPVESVDYTSDEGIRRLADADVVLHLGAFSGVMACAKDPQGTARINVEGTRRLAAALSERKIPIAFASSFAVVGAPEVLPVTEDTPARPTHEYARQKAAGEAIMADTAQQGRIATAVVRMSNVYGSYHVGDRTVAKGNVLALFLEQAPSGTLNVNAPGTQRRDFIHIEDIVAFWVAIADKLNREREPKLWRFNLASGEAYSVLEIADLVRSTWTRHYPGAQLKVEVVRNPREGIELIDPEFSVDPSQTVARLGLSCRHSVRSTIEELLAASPSPPVVTR